jgi:hypothetical protein
MPWNLFKKLLLLFILEKKSHFSKWSITYSIHQNELFFDRFIVFYPSCNEKVQNLFISMNKVCPWQFCKNEFWISFCKTKVIFTKLPNAYFVHRYEPIFGYFIVFYLTYNEKAKNWFISMSKVFSETYSKNDFWLSFWKSKSFFNIIEQPSAHRYELISEYFIVYSWSYDEIIIN